MGKEKILVVDDMPYLRLLVKKFLERAGFEVVEAQNGIDALSALRTESNIRVILLDLMMPKMNGLEFLSQVIAQKKELGIKICAITAKETPDDIKGCLSKGADDYIVKPIDEYILVDKVKILLSHLDVDDFSSRDFDEIAFIDMPKGHEPLEINITALSESSIRFKTTHAIPNGARIFIKSDEIQKLFGKNYSMLVRVYKVEKSGLEYTVVASYVGLKDTEYKLLRSITTKGG